MPVAWMKKMTPAIIMKAFQNTVGSLAWKILALEQNPSHVQSFILS
jgi:hypothetical protein